MMVRKRIGDLFQVRSRFLRSAHLERDFNDPTCLSGYVVTNFTSSCLGYVANGLKPRSGQRAWRMTGDYGSGKSSFALLLAHWFAGHEEVFPPELLKAVTFRQFGVRRRPDFVPVLVTLLAAGFGNFNPKLAAPNSDSDLWKRNQEKSRTQSSTSAQCRGTH